LHRTIDAPHEVTLFVIKNIAFILGKNTTLSVIDYVITLALDILEILLDLIFSQLYRIPFNEVSLVEVMVFGNILNFN